jgi:branched-chain amino acid transport system ATP-binding protein
MRAHKMARMGIVHAPEGRSVFSTLTVQENLELTFRQAFGRGGWRKALRDAYERFPRLGERRKQVAGTLSGGEQRMLSLARVLVHEPKLLVTDELSLGLAPVIIDEVYETLSTIRDSGT